MKKVFHFFLTSLKILFLSFLIIYLLYPKDLFSQNKYTIKLTNNKILSNEEIKKLTSSINNQNAFVFKDSIKNTIAKTLKKESYYFPNIEIDIDTLKNEIQINIDEGFPAILKKINYNYAFNDSLKVKRHFNFLINEYFSEVNFQNTIDELLSYFENNGFPFAKISIENIYFEIEDSFYSVTIQLNIERNSQCYINNFEIQGNNKTKDYVIIRSSGIKLNNIYKQDEIDKIKPKLNRLRFFESVDEPQFYLTNDNKGILKLTLKEKETNSFDGIVGYIPSAQSEKGFLTGYLNFNFDNLFGTGRLFKFKWQQASKNSQDLEIKYLEPWIFNFPLNIQFGLYQRKQDSTFIQRNFESTFELLTNFDFSFSLSVSSQSTISTLNKLNNFYNSNSTSYGFLFKTDTRDEIISPTSGFMFAGSYKYFSKRINNFSIDKTSLQKIEFDFSLFQEIFHNQVFAISIHGKELKGDLADISDLYFLGGVNSLRGYREKQFLANRLIWSNIEYRFLLFKSSFAYVFFDLGYYLLNENHYFNINKNQDVKFGYGLGFNIETNIGIIGVSFALGKGDSFSNGKIHFIIMNEF